jgi:hypothetical protein
MALELIKLVKGSSAVAQVGSFGFFKLSADTGGGGGDLTFSRVFSENTPEQISAVSAVISANNMTSAQVAETYGWNIGDSIDITLSTNETIQMRIIGFNHDDKSDGSGKAGITLQMTHCLATKKRMAVTNFVNKWETCEMRTTTLPSIKETLPSEWVSVIKNVNKIQYTSSSKFSTVSDDLFLLSESEIWGSKVNAFSSDEGVWYPYWQQGNTKIMQWDSNGDGVLDADIVWYLRSGCRVSGESGFCVIQSTGVADYTVYTKNSFGVSFAFCV